MDEQAATTPVPPAQAVPDKLTKPLDASTVLAFMVCGLILTALSISVYTQDHALTSDISKNFIGPGFLLIIGYYFGSTSSSKVKDATISNQAATINEQTQ